MAIITHCCCSGMKVKSSYFCPNVHKSLAVGYDVKGMYFTYVVAIPYQRVRSCRPRPSCRLLLMFGFTHHIRHTVSNTSLCSNGQICNFLRVEYVVILHVYFSEFWVISEPIGPRIGSSQLCRKVWNNSLRVESTH